PCARRRRRPFWWFRRRARCRSSGRTSQPACTGSRTTGSDAGSALRIPRRTRTHRDSRVDTPRTSSVCHGVARDIAPEGIAGTRCRDSPRTRRADPAPADPALPSRWTTERYLRLVDEGVLGPDDKVELLEGVIVAMAPSNVPHDGTIGLVSHALFRAVA